ncbi:hypothetical protein [Actinomadura rugatobispora]|uniref:Uncharacterized protein n=1 Tax=Actinomadura rugatobispora TaxID=1994 RepID=A0ABW1A1J1_9ACTN|nr:hypothetical protein GCM10010200_011620 [Actinomadura rugatobispora]
MTAQHESPDVFVSPIPRTINAIGPALTEGKRAEFSREVLAAEQGAQLDEVMNRWWMEAMLDRAPGRERRGRDARAGRGLVPLPGRVEDGG